MHLIGDGAKQGICDGLHVLAAGAIWVLMYIDRIQLVVGNSAPFSKECARGLDHPPTHRAANNMVW